MKSLKLYILFAGFIFSMNGNAQDIKEYFSSVKFTYANVSGTGYEKGCTRRDPSDIIKAGDTWYVYYTKIYGRSPGYWGTVWCASSKDERYSWKELGEVVGPGKKDMFDSQATFTPNILCASGKYYLYYTGVKPTPRNEKVSLKITPPPILRQLVLLFVILLKALFHGLVTSQY